jgi:hypothetical protein
MKRKAIQIILVIAISLAIPVPSVYTIYYTVEAAEFFSPDLNIEVNIEAFDQENLLATHLSKLKGSQSGIFFNEFQLTTYLFGLPSYLSFKISSPDQKIIILRC